MNNLKAALSTALLLLTVSLQVGAEERMIAGNEQGANLIATGAADAVLSPARIVNEIGADVRDFGVGGVVTGAVTGSVKGAGQALRGGGRMLIGILDVLTAPIRNSRYNRNQPGGIR